MERRQAQWIGTVAMAALLMGGCQVLGLDGRASIDTQVNYRERMMLPPDSRITVRLQDVSKADGAAETLDEQQLVSAGKAPPYSLTLRYDPAQIDQRHRYAVRAEIRNAGKLMFTTTEHIDPFAEDSPRPLALLVHRVGGHTPTLNTASLNHTYWKLVRLEDRAVVEGWGGEALYIRFDAEAAHAGGFSGCNRFSASFKLSGSGIRFGPIMSTRRACASGMEQEGRFLTQLEAAVGYSIKGSMLALLNAERKVMAVFEAQASP
ncbi:YbaY family lipoprotein [Aestuariirhabdus sp. LZHN29]|uniref:YbaY family lipoprotein n=1 Tax=Aestuariirhabdus sp. LZHN29 TaxID=3417462 RepID=UPI003CE9DB54